ncbi:hypothetical protein MNBD_ALPHA04-708 [hydrothermal vent metagenome]|uniref:Glycosyltransferase RgtA/B/C/D-like domain-containing protein n=1 Tax=hydrothermal vent metagenome TaxID=652676 RepID=A0A3B0S4D3_9ZZZZ
MSKAYPHYFEGRATATGDHALGLNRVEYLTFGAIVLCAVMQAVLIFVQEINWDEFYFLSLIYEHQRGELTKALQTIHVYLFGWLPMIDGNEIRQIEVARAFMLASELGIMACIYGLSRLFVPRQSALIAVLAYASAGFVLLHGASFRADPIAAFLMMAALVLIARSKLRFADLMVAASMIALAGLVTVKAVFYAPALIGLGLWRVVRSEYPASDFGKLAGLGLGALAIFGSLYWLHQSALPAADLAGSEAMMSSAAQTTLLDVNFFPRMGDAIQGASLAFVQAILFFAGLFFAFREFAENNKARTGIAVLFALAAPLLSFLFYRNAFPYYFAFIFPPAMVLVAFAAHRFSLSSRIWVALIAVMFLSSVLLFSRTLERDQEAQAQVVDAVHKIFPEPVAAIDRNSMIASFPKRGIFMSTWGLKDYRGKGDPIFADILQNDIVPLLILNSPSLEEAVGDKLTAPLRARLLPTDRVVLSQNYIPHWGKIWVAGKKLNLGSVPVIVTILIPGTYQVESDFPVIFDGKEIAGGEVIHLGRGEYLLSSGQSQTAILRWGKNLYRPTNKPADKPIYRGF